MIKRGVISLSLVLVLAGCGLRPALPEESIKFTPSTKQDIQISSEWWREFEDTSLNKLIENAMKNNADLQTAYINIQKAARTLGISKADWLPSLGLNAGYNRSGAGATGRQNPTNSFSLGASLSYELDIWGKVKDSVEIAGANLKASGFDYDAARLSIAASVAKGYFKLSSLLAQKDVYEKSLKIYEQTKNQYAQKLLVGAISQSEYLQSEASVQNALLRLANLDAQISQAQAALSILCGDSLDEIIYGVTDVSSSVMPKFAGGIAADILEHRPDVAAAWQRVVSSNIAIGLEKKAWLPSLSLVGKFGYSSMDANDLVSAQNSAWSFGGSLLQNLFDGGRINAKIDIAKLSAQAAFISYESVVKKAISEAVTALDSASSAWIVYERAKEILHTQEKIYDLAKIKFDNGATEYITLLDAQRTLLNTQLELVNSEFSQKMAIVDVYKALGGGWSDKTEE